MLLWFKEVDSGFGLVEWCIHVIWRMFAFFGLSQYSDQGSSAFYSCALTVNVIGRHFLHQCFTRLPSSTETSISGTSRELPICNLVSKYENGLTWREFMLLWLEGSVGGLGWWWCDVKMVGRWCWRMREIECTPMDHCNNECGLWRTVIFLVDGLMIFHAFWPLYVIFLPFVSCPKHGLVARRWWWECEFGRKGGDGIDGEHIEKVRV
jgi:hypothetical protein